MRARATSAPLHLLLLLLSFRTGSSAPSLGPSSSGSLGEDSASQDGSVVCRYEGREYAAGAAVPTPEKCLTCRCGERGGAPLCRLQVCPELPVPPPRGCVLVHRRGECCQRLVCEPPADSPDTESRNSLTKITAENVDIASDNGCVVNGTRYAEGSATGSSSLCEYCYCVRGGQRCVRPQCEMPLQGCTPRYRTLACCPVSYDCSGGANSTGVASTTSTTTLPPRPSGCLVDGARHTEGAQVRALAGNCERCYCLRGAVRCVTLECAPPLMGCSPVFAPGRCCPVQYNCSKIMTEPRYRERQDSDMTILLQMAEGERGSSAELRRHREMTENTTTNTTEATSTKATSDFESGAGVEEEENSVEKPADQHNEIVVDTTSADETGNDTTTSAPKNQTEIAVTDQVNEQEAIEARTETSATEDTTTEDTTLLIETTESPQSTEEVAITTNEVPVTDPETTVLQEKTEEITTVMAPSSTEPSTVPPKPQVIEDRVDNLEELLDLLLDDTTVAPKEVPTTVTTTSSTTTTTTTTPAPTTLPPSIPTTLSPLIEALLHAKNKEEVMENEYGTALPPSLPNITMIPFLPEDAVVDKKKDSYTSTESGIHFKNAVQSQGSQGFSPPAAFVGGFVPRQPPLLDEIPLFYPTSPQPDSGDILTAPQASLPPIISLTTPSPEVGIDSITVESTITLANPAATRDVPLTSHIRVAAGHRACTTPDGREVAHGDLLASPGPCEVCRCDRGTVHCHEETACSERPMVQDRVDMEPERFTTPSPGSLHGLANLAPPENKVAEEEGDFSLDSVFDFLFMHGESTVAPPPPPLPSPPPMTPAVTRARPTRPPPQDPPPPPLPASVAGILKLAGCNIYGRMYRVGRIISELSGPCRECRCTELGVQCRPLLC